jgi:hypothetical protein
VFTRFWLGGLKVRGHWEDSHRWEDNVKMGLREVGIDGSKWIRLTQDRVQWRAFVCTVMSLRVP